MGLRDGVDYNDEKNYSQLRYGHIMIMVDQDYDGSHIKGLLINLFHIFWPSLIKRRNFLLEFVTPIVVCKKGPTRKEFFTIPEYENWKSALDTKLFEIKYYKGLGTSSNAEAEQYFSDLNKHQIKFEYTGEKDDQAISLAFSKSKAEERKQWLAGFIPGTYLDHNTDSITYDQFIHKELILFSMADNQRSIPSMVDGLKPGQRKILHSCLRRNLTKSAKVPQIAGFVMSDTAYHHGDAALQGTIIKMAQDFCGSNNLNLLLPVGQFGSRSQGGKDAANARYISTHLNPVTRLVFHKDDGAVLNYLNDDGIEIEPEWFVPTIPMVLVNGAEGIGTGWSSSVPVYCPSEIIAAIRAKIKGEKYPALHPWYRNWKGSLRYNPVKKDYAMVGRVQVVDSHTLRITELPVKTWTEPYKEHLAKLYEDGVISNILEEHSIDGIDFTLETSPQNPVAKVTDFLLKTLKLTGTISMTNIVLFDKDGKLRRYNGPDEIVDEFFGLKLEFLQKRKDHIIKTMELEMKIIENKARFIISIVNKELKITNRPKKDIFEYLKTNNFDTIHKNDEKEQTGENEDRGYDYLLSMSIWTLTTERFEKLKKDASELRQRLDDYRKVTIDQIWLDDLAALEIAVNDFYDAAAKANAGRKRKAPAKTAKMVKSKQAATKTASAVAANGKGGIFTKTGNDKIGIFSKIIANESWEETDFAVIEKKDPAAAKAKTQKAPKANGKTKKTAKEAEKNDEAAEIKQIAAEKEKGEANGKQSSTRPRAPPKKKNKDEEKCFDTTSSADEESSEPPSSFASDGSAETERENGGSSLQAAANATSADEGGNGFCGNKNLWICHLCTYQNNSQDDSCEMCSIERR